MAVRSTRFNQTKSKAATSKIAIVAMHGVVPFDLSIPCAVFGHVRIDGRPAYQVRVCSETRLVKAGLFDIRVASDLSHVALADTVIVPGIDDPGAPISKKLIEAIRQAAASGARIASICSGTFILAATGLLDGLRVTTHWLGAQQLAERYPALTVDANVLYVDNGRVLTSAGASAGFDLCLHMVRCDHGAAVAADAARLAVMPLERDGGQSQFIVNAPPNSVTTLQPLLDWTRLHLDKPLSLDDLAKRARLSTRTLSRRFVEQTGTTVLQWILHQRVRRAQQLLESTPLSIERIAIKTGFGSATAFRDRFGRLVGTSPQRYRKTFGASKRS